MKQTTFQHPELRDANDNIIQQGAFGKNTALANSTNDGWIDYVANDLEALYNNTMGGTGGEINTETITGKTGTITTLTATTVKAGTVTADALNGPLTGNVTGDLNGNVTGDVTGNLTGNVTGTADKAVADGSGNNIVNTYVTKSGLSTSVSTTSLTVSGTTSVPTANAGNSSKAIANTEFVQGELTNYLPLSGGTLTGVVDGVTPPNGDNSKKLATTEFVNAKAGLPVGFQYFQTTPNVPAGSLPLLGGEYSRTTYADLWAWVQTQSGYLIEESAWQAKAASNGGNVPFYSKGDGSTTFRVPALKCWVRGANSINEVGGYLAAGLPNITGDMGFSVSFMHPTGAFEGTTNKTTCPAAYGPDANYNLNIDASRSSSIYGNSNTVQPESIVGMWVVKAYGTVTNVGSTDVSAIAQGLTEAETRISTAALTGVVQAFAGRTMPQGWLLCDGSAVSRTDYAALYAVIGTTYGAGNGSTTFNLPNLTDKFIQGSSTAGTEHSAGLPNITGSTNWLSSSGDATVSGAIYWDRPSVNHTQQTAGSGLDILTFDASRSNSIYGNSNTVQPPALTMRYIIKY